VAIGSQLDDPAEAYWCHSLFSHPIAWKPGQTSVVNGQHRACALRASGALWCVADLCDGVMHDDHPGHPRARASAEVACFWIQQAGRQSP
jgi:hypothetical protein